MKVIFLDFDGVLNSQEFLKQHNDGVGASQVDPRAVARLDRLVQATGAKIVVSSAWRHIWDIEQLQEILAQTGLSDPSCVIDRTPTGEGNRGQEIQDWMDLDEEREVVNPDHEPIESYVILDDSDDMLHQHMEHFIRTDANKGLQDRDVQKAIAILGMGV